MAPTKPIVKTVARSRIVVDPDILPRMALADDTSARYRELLEEGHKFPPLDVFDLKPDSTSDIGLFLVDGSYRLAALDAKHPDGKYKLKVTIHQGTRADALWFAAGANQDHGLPLTHAQRLKALAHLLADGFLAAMSDRALGKQCGLDHKTVASYRPERQETLPLDQRPSGEIPQGAPPVTARESGGEEPADSAGATAGAAPCPPRASESSGPGAPDPGSPVAPAEWPEPIRDVILDGTARLRGLVTLCRQLDCELRILRDLRPAGVAMFHVPAALERLKRLKRAITRAIPYCVCPECKGTGRAIARKYGAEECPRCNGRGWLVRAETDEDQPTPNQIAQFEIRGVDMPGEKAEAARQLDDLFAAETWQDRQKHQANQAEEDSETWE